MQDINMVAMQVIMNACSGRDKVDEALEAMAKNDFDRASILLDEADQDLLKAHVAQTSMIQSQAAGNDTEYSLLFIHAQDTLMTSNSEMRIAKNVLPVFIKQSQMIEQMRKGA